MKDALGSEIVEGKYYGYSRVKNGIVTVVVGKVVKKTEKRITLSDVVKQWGAYGNPNTTKSSKNVSVYSRTCFPIDINQLNIQ